MILSASRRTDIPAFYADWFMNRIRAGFYDVRNPMNPNQVSRVILDPAIVDCIVFWTKNPRPLLPYLSELDECGYKYYFTFTLNNYGRDMEPDVPDVAERIATFRQLSERIGSERVIWRYDPIVLTDKYDIPFHCHNFAYLLGELAGYTNKCVFSFVDVYDKIKKNMNVMGYAPFTLEKMYELADFFAVKVRNSDIVLFTCSEKLNLGQYGIRSNKCIDNELIEKITGSAVEVNKDSSQRAECGCVKSEEIGAYNTCRHGCKYCYANYSQESVDVNLKFYSVHSSFLIDDSVKFPKAKITLRKSKSYAAAKEQNLFGG